MSSIKIFRAEFPSGASEVLDKAADIVATLLDPHSARLTWHRHLGSRASDCRVVRLMGESGQGPKPEEEELRLLMAAQDFGTSSSTLTMVFEVMASPLEERGVEMADLHLANASEQAVHALARSFPEARWQSAEALCDDHDPAVKERRLADLTHLATLPPRFPRKPPYLATTDELPHADLAEAGMRDGLDRIRSTLLLTLDMPEEKRGPLVGAALAMAADLPIEIEENPANSPYDIAEAFEHPSFDFLLKGGKDVPILPRLSELQKTTGSDDASFLGNPNASSVRFFPSDPQNRLAQARRRRAEARRLDELRRPYFQELKGGNSRVMRARGLAMVFPHLPERERLAFGADIRSSLTDIRSNPIAKAIGLLALARVAIEDDRADAAGFVHPGPPIVAGERTKLVMDPLVQAVGAVEDPALRARLCRRACALLPDPQRGEVLRMGRTALRNLEGGAPAASDALRAEIAWIGLAYSELSAWPSWRPAEDDRFAERASTVAHMVRDPLKRAQLLLALARRPWSDDGFDNQPPGDFALAFHEAVTTLDALAHDKAEGVAWYVGFRARNVGNRLDPDAPTVVEMTSTRAASAALGLSDPPVSEKPVLTTLQDWAVTEINAWLNRTLPDAWPSLPPVRFPPVPPPRDAASRRRIAKEATALAMKDAAIAKTRRHDDGAERS
jgi:hypothetical protein